MHRCSWFILWKVCTIHRKLENFKRSSNFKSRLCGHKSQCQSSKNISWGDPLKLQIGSVLTHFHKSKIMEGMDRATLNFFRTIIWKMWKFLICDTNLRKLKCDFNPDVGCAPATEGLSPALASTFFSKFFIQKSWNFAKIPWFHSKFSKCLQFRFLCCGSKNLVNFPSAA